MSKPLTLEALRARIDELDADLLRLAAERAGLAETIAAAKAAAGEGGVFALRPAREAQLLRRLLTMPHAGAGPALVVRIWREFISDSLSRQGPFHLACWGGRDPARIIELARFRFGAAPLMVAAAKPDQAIAAAKIPGGVGVLALEPENAWWGRLLAEPRVRVFAALPCLHAWGSLSALAVAQVLVEPSGGDETFWVTDAPQPAAAVEDALGRCGLPGRMVAQAGGLKLFALAGFVQEDDSRLTTAPGDLKGVIGAAPTPLDV